MVAEFYRFLIHYLGERPFLGQLTQATNNKAIKVLKIPDLYEGQDEQYGHDRQNKQ